ncbi:MAG TPA: ABC transporter permease, partial [Vicinamibacterales bacterium]|nr:ABC transporter permease [Vicinamibacterales bacterium]
QLTTIPTFPSSRSSKLVDVTNDLFRDVRHAVRAFAKAKGFTVAALLTLALGIGANTAIFSLVNAALLQPLPYPEPDRLVQLVRRSARYEADGQTGRRYLFFREHLQGVAALAAARNPTGFNLVVGGDALFIRAMPVSKEYFAVFGVRPLWGTTFGAEHDAAGGPQAAVLGHALWARLFNSDPAVIGTSILLGGNSYVVLGVMPASFRTTPEADLFVPLRPSTTGPGGGYNYGVTGRLKDGVTMAQASDDAARVFRAMAAAFPGEVRENERPSALTSYQSQLSRESRPFLLMIFGAVGLVLAIACANTANLLLARASARTREIALRVALGARRRRIVVQLLTESVLLSLGGAVIGVALAYASLPALFTLVPPGTLNGQEPAIDGRVLLFTLAVAIATGVIFGLAPALSLTRQDLAEAFRQDGIRTVGSRRSTWLRSALVVGEVSLCMLLLVGAGLLIQTFVRLRAVDPGFDPAGVVAARMSLQGDRYASAGDVNRFFAEGLDRLRAIPGVTSAAVVNGVPIERGLNLNVDVLDGPAPAENRLVDWRYASGDYFATMGIPIVAGRGFGDGDRAGAPPIAVVNESFVRHYLTGTGGLGYHLRVFDSDVAMEIVGIAKDVSESGLRHPAPPLMYVPVTQANAAGIRASHTYFPMTWVVRTAAPGAELERRMREAIRTLDPQQPFSTFSTMTEVKGAAFATEQRQMAIVTLFAAAGLLLAAAGVYGLIAYSIAQRTRELGIRIALGATPGTIVRGVVWHGARLALLGIAIGAASAVALTRMLERFVWGVSTLDPLTFATVPLVLLAISAVASLVPALRATRLNPLTAIRE